jgi:Fe-S cluster assembly scaffold protein SufB
MGSRGWLEEVRRRALEGLSIAPPYGPDVDVLHYVELNKRVAPGRPDLSRASEVGIDLERAGRSAYYLQVDQRVLQYLSRVPGVEVTTVEEFIERDPDLAAEYLWKLLDPSKDRFTAAAALYGFGGFVVRVKKGVRVEEPIQTCLFMSSPGLQAPHNIVILEEGAEVTVYTGCTIMPEPAGLHVGVSEFYVGRGARLRYVMVHSWNRVTHVRPRTAVKVCEGGEYVSYYISFGKVRSIQTFPTVYLGKGARAYLASILLGLEDSEIDVGSYVTLSEDSSAQVVSRVLARDRSKVWTRATISGSSGRGHIDCRGMLIHETAQIYAVPELRALGREAQLTHEAAIGKLSEDEIAYLMSKGFSREEAEGILIRGFINVDLDWLPSRIRGYVEGILNLVASRA